MSTSLALYLHVYVRTYYDIADIIEDYFYDILKFEIISE